MTIKRLDSNDKMSMCPENPPTRATTEANLATRDMLIEIQVSAAL
jgi:enamine deaminase RidA (YjgF/YER057c/UK114 family)